MTKPEQIRKEVSNQISVLQAKIEKLKTQPKKRKNTMILYSELAEIKGLQTGLGSLILISSML